MTYAPVPTSTAGRCSGKRIWPDISTAKRIAKRTPGDRMTAYHCNACHGWHVGTHVGTPRRKVERRRPEPA